MKKEELRKRLKYYPETGLFIWLNGRRKGRVAGYKTKDGYIRIQVNNQEKLAHVWAFIYMGKKLPEQIDHINRRKNDNRWKNLRESNYSLNQVNTNLSRRNKSGFKGVYWKSEKQKYCASLHWREGEKRKSKHLGYFDCPEEAHQAYMKARKERYGI